MLKKIYIILITIHSFKISWTIRVEENGKDLPGIHNQDLYSDRRRRPVSGSSSGCNFSNPKRKPVYKTDGSGRTFLSFINVGYDYDYQINCGSISTGQYHNPYNDHNSEIDNTKPEVDEYNKPGIGQHIKPGLGGHKPGFGGHHKPGLGIGQNGFGQFGNRPPHKPFLTMLIANRPLQQLFGQVNAEEGHQPSVINNIATSFSGILPSPQEFGQGLGDGFASFVQTLPQIGQSFQSLLPNFNNFQWPQFGAPSAGSNIPNSPIAPIPPPTIPNDDIKPVHEDHDPVTDPYKRRLRPGNRNDYNSDIYYQQRNFRSSPHQAVLENRNQNGFRFPT